MSSSRLGPGLRRDDGSRVIPAAAMRRWAGIPFLLLLAFFLASCGFQLRGAPALGIRALNVTSTGASQVAAEIRRTLATGPTRVVTDLKQADAQLRVLQEVRDKSVATITTSGTVYEFELRLVVRYELTVPGREIPVIAPVETVAKRLVTYSASAPIAKEAEEQLMYKEMQTELADRILRHVASAARREL